MSLLPHSTGQIKSHGQIVLKRGKQTLLLDVNSAAFVNTNRVLGDHLPQHSPWASEQGPLVLAPGAQDL